MEVLTHTKRRDFQTCQRYFFHRHEQLLTLRYPKGGRRRGSAFGDAIFAISQAMRSGDHTNWEVIAKAKVEEAYDEIHPADQEEANQLEVEIVKLSLLAPEYCARYGFKFGVHERRELQFDLPLINPATRRPSRSFRRGGKIDGLIPLSGGKRAVVVEDKLVGTIQRAMIERLPLDAQISEYVDALIDRGWTAEVYYRHTLFPGSNPKVVGRKTKSEDTRHRESLDEYRDRLAEDISTRHDHYFDEQRLVFSTGHLEDYRAGRWDVARQILRKRREAKRTDSPMLLYPMNPSRCWEYGGCEFIPLCTKRPGADALYTVTTDNPELRKDDNGATAEYPAGA